MAPALLAGAVLLAAVPAVANGDPDRGREVFEQCASCHTLDGEHGVGPSLQGLIGRRSGTVAEFRYSPPMRRANIVWTRTTLDSFLADPQAVVRGNRMPFSGLPEAKDREDILAFLDQAGSSQ